ncbi:hypothetical protein RvY_10728 [Ramazzottius varieornatus]|uniref:Uncharacterized protein n=1 Tax=Ramazzottius varieornatus TaxID=947166 RepID=A0A1D1VDR3_RAMVA|nr:hypothetical protein RvY_10728 [Ramazzottius varieornatus]
MAEAWCQTLSYNGRKALFRPSSRCPHMGKRTSQAEMINVALILCHQIASMCEKLCQQSNIDSNLQVKA